MSRVDPPDELVDFAAMIARAVSSGAKKPDAAVIENTRRKRKHGVSGIKTGTLAQAGACPLYSAIVSIPGLSRVTLIGVVLNAGSHDSIDADVEAFIKSITDDFHTVKLTSLGENYGQYLTAWRSHARVVAANTASVLTWSNTKITSTATTTTITSAPSGTKVGSVTFVAGPSAVTVPLVLDGAITPPDAWWRLTHPTELHAK